MMDRVYARFALFRCHCNPVQSYQDICHVDLSKNQERIVSYIPLSQFLKDEIRMLNSMVDIFSFLFVLF